MGVAVRSIWVTPVESYITTNIFSGFLYFRGQEKKWHLYFAFSKFQTVKPTYKRNV
jgi:hypothetical protein